MISQVERNKHNNSRRLTGKAKSMVARPVRSRRVLSVSTSFSGLGPEYAEMANNAKHAQNQTTIHKMPKRISNASKYQMHMVDEDEDEEEVVNTSNIIREVESDEDSVDKHPLEESKE